MFRNGSGSDIISGRGSDTICIINAITGVTDMCFLHSDDGDYNNKVSGTLDIILYDGNKVSGALDFMMVTKYQVPRIRTTGGGED